MHFLMHNLFIVISIVLVCIKDILAVDHGISEIPNCHTQLMNADFIDDSCYENYYIVLDIKRKFRNNVKHNLSENDKFKLSDTPKRYYDYILKFHRCYGLCVGPKTFCYIVECEERLHKSNDTTSWYEELDYGEEYNDLFIFYGMLINYGRIGSGKDEHLIRAKCTMQVCIAQLKKYSLGSGANNMQIVPEYDTFQDYYSKYRFKFAIERLPGTLVFCLSATYEVEFEYSPFQMYITDFDPVYGADYDVYDKIPSDLTTITNFNSIISNSDNDYDNATKYNSVILDYKIFLENNVDKNKKIPDKIDYFGRPINYSLLRACINEAKLICSIKKNKGEKINAANKRKRRATDEINTSYAAANVLHSSFKDSIENLSASSIIASTVVVGELKFTKEIAPEIGIEFINSIDNKPLSKTDLDKKINEFCYQKIYPY